MTPGDSDDPAVISPGTKSSITVLVSSVEHTASERSRDRLQWKDSCYAERPIAG